METTCSNDLSFRIPDVYKTCLVRYHNDLLIDREYMFQVLLLDQQRGDLPNPPANPDAEERSFLFLIHPPGKDNFLFSTGAMPSLKLSI